MSTAERLVFQLLSESNKPCNLQGVADMLASKGVKKGQAEKALTALADKGKIKVKEFGKTKIFFLSQEGLPELDPEEKAAKLSEIKDLTEEVRQVEETVSQLKKELSSVRNNLTTEQMQTKFEELQEIAESLNKKLAIIGGDGESRISSSDIARVESRLSKYVKEWSRRKRIFMNIWDAVSENLDGKQADLFEDIGIDSDESIGELLSKYQKLVQSMSSQNDAKRARLSK